MPKHFSFKRASLSIPIRLSVTLILPLVALGLLLILLGGVGVPVVRATSPTTVSIDGTNDFEADEDVAGTSGSTWYFTWDATDFYFATDNDNVDDNDSNKWVLLYIDVDPQANPLTGNGTSTGVQYNTQQPTLPFNADYHFRWKTDNTYTNIQEWNGSAWVDAGATFGPGGDAEAFQNGTYVEFRISRSFLISPSALYVVGTMINEVGGSESTFYMTPDSNTEGYDADLDHYFGFALNDGVSPAAAVHEDNYPFARLEITKTVSPVTAVPGQNVTYTITYANAGGGTAPNVLITDDVPISVTHVSYTFTGALITPTGGVSYTWAVNNLVPGTGGVITITGQLSNALPYDYVLTNTATITTTAVDTDTTNNEDAVTLAMSYLSITKTASSPVTAGRRVIYTITIVNEGALPAQGVVISDALPLGTSLVPVNQTDEYYGNPFAQGSGDNIAWHPGRPQIPTDNWIELADPALYTGVYTSRIIDAYNVVDWTSLEWWPRRPYGKALPDWGQAETDYDQGNANMTGNHILLHLDELPGPTVPTGTIIFPPGAAVFTDTSGLDNHGACPAIPGETCPAAQTDGRFGGAINFYAMSQTVAITDDASPDRYAVELWVRPAAVTNTSFILHTDSTTYTIDPGHYSHLLGIAGDKFMYYVNDGSNKQVVGTTTVMTDTWYHVVGTAQSGGDIKLYVNGQQEGRLSGIGTLWAGGDHYRLGASYGPTGTSQYFLGDLDEVAVYSRTLSASEIRDHYLRGVLRLDFQVRSCDDAVCAGEAFVGPGGLITTTYIDQSAPGAGLPVVSLTDAITDARYFQYQAAFETENTGYSPQLRRVRVGPAHRVVTATQGSCVAPGAQAFTCTLGTIPAGGVVTVSTSADVGASVLGTITNTAAIVTPIHVTATATATVVGEADLIILKHDHDWNGGTDPVNPGSPMTYTLQVRNAGPSTAFSVTVTDTLPVGAVVFTATAPTDWDPCQFSGNAVTCTVPSLAPTYRQWYDDQDYDWAEIVITATAPITTGLVTNTAAINSVTTEFAVTDNITIETTLITPTADVRIDKTAEPDLVRPGETLTYVITVTNQGPYTATNVIVTDTLPVSTGYPICGPEWLCTLWPGGQVVGALVNPLTPTHSASFAITITAPLSGFLANSAHVVAEQYDLWPDNNWDAAYTSVEREADLSIGKSDDPDPVDAGAPLTYTLTITNNGPMAAGVLTTTISLRNGRYIDVPLVPGAATPYGSGMYLANLPGLVRNITITLHGLSHGYPADLGVLLVGPGGRDVILMANAGGGTEVSDLTLHFNDGGVSIGEPLTDTVPAYHPTNNGFSDDFELPAPPAPYGGSLSTFYNSSPNGQWRLYVIDTVYSDEGQIAGGWSLQVTTVTTDTVTVTDTLPADLGDVQVSGGPSDWTCQTAGRDITCETDYLPIGVPNSLDIRTTAPDEGGVITNTAGITATTLDTDPVSNTVSITTTVIPVVDLEIAKRVEPETVIVGDPLTYTLSITNLGPSTADLVTVTDVLPDDLGSVGTPAGPGWSCNLSGQAFTCTVASLAAGPAPDILITATAPITPGIITNTATLTSTPADEWTLNNSAQVTATVVDAAVAGLVALNDSPTELGNPTFFTATITDGTNVSFAWAFGNGATAAGNPLSYTYPATGTYTAIVTATNSANWLTATTIVTVFVPSADLVLVKQAHADTVEAGAPLTFTLSITNAGPDDVTTPVTVTDTLPDDLTGVGVAGGGWACDTSALPVLTCTLDSLAVGPAPDILITATAPITAGALVNSASVTSTLFDPNTGNNSDSATVTVVPNQPPIADAGPDQVVFINTVATLDGSGSSDPDGDLPLTYGWQQTGGPNVSFVRAMSVTTFTAPGAPTVLTFSLVVTDAQGLASLPDTVVITVSEETIVGLLAVNDSPTVIGNPTTFTATITAGTNVSYAWAFGDGSTATGNPVNYTYPATGTYTAIVTATNESGLVTATTQAQVIPQPVRPIYLPLVLRNYASGPDLVVEELAVTGNSVTLTIRNQGQEPVEDEFWVDVYVAPDIVPTQVNQTWQHVGSQGMVWGVTVSALPLEAGGTLVLTVDDAYYRADASEVTWPLADDTPVYAQVDSAHAETEYGAVLENHEISGIEYNNIVGPVTPASVTGARPQTSPAQQPGPSGDLPPRP